MAYQDIDKVPLIEGEQTFGSIDRTIADVPLEQKRHNKKSWLAPAGVAFLFVNILGVTVGWLLYQGIGIWGNNIPTAWAFDIVNFVWWIGIGHAGTLISAILLLMRQQWRNSINRFSEAMTIFAVMCAGMFPLLHTGRPWVAFYWLFPFPNILGIWPQFKSPLMWDVFAVSTYFTVSLVFWYIGLIPDFATLRDRAKHPAQKYIYAFLSLGWRGSAKHWHRYEQAYLLLAGLSTPLVLSVHSIVSFDFAVSVIPGWNVSVFPPYFVAGAVYAGFAMVILLMIPVRKMYGLENVVTMKHFDWMAKITLATGLIVAYGYSLELFYGWYSGNKMETALLSWRMDILHKPYSWLYWSLILCNVIIPQAFWSAKARQSWFWLIVVCLSVNIGMWLERFVIIPMSLMNTYLPSSQRYYYPTIWDFSMFFGTVGFFIFMMFLFIRFLPAINVFEVKDLLHRIYHERRGKREEALATSGGQH